MKIFIIILFLVGIYGIIQAENSIPGHYLYDVKIRFNEGVMKVVYAGPKAQGDLKLDLIERRFKESLELIKREKLTIPVAEELINKIDSYIENIRLAKINLNDRGAEFLAEDLEIRLQRILFIYEEVHQILKDKSPSE